MPACSRGYKSGGFNTDGTLDADLRQFDPKRLCSAEIGVKGNWRDDSLVRTSRAVLHVARRYAGRYVADPRLRPDGSSEFIEYHRQRVERRQLRARGRGCFQADSAHRTVRQPRWPAIVGVPRNFVNGAGQELDGRQQAQAPSYQFFATRAVPFAERLAWRTQPSKEKDAYYFSDSDSFQSKPYELAHLSVGIKRDNWG